MNSARSLALALDTPRTSSTKRVIIAHLLGVYVLALLAGGVVLIAVYALMCPHAPSAGQRFAARLVAGPAAMVIFVTIFHVLGEAGSLSPTDGARSWRGDSMLAIALGVLYAILWPLNAFLSRWFTDERGPESGVSNER